MKKLNVFIINVKEIKKIKKMNWSESLEIEEEQWATNTGTLGGEQEDE